MVTLEPPGHLNSVGESLVQISCGDPVTEVFELGPSLREAKADGYYRLFHEQKGIGGASRRQNFNKH